MNRILFLLIFCTFALAETILIPEDFATIQEGIDASVDGDTVLVADGDYVENLVLDKSIVLTSYAIYDNLDEWIIFDEYYFSRWVINNSHIENTRLIGSSPDDPDYGSVILITPDAEECISPEIVGFTITGGSGTKVVREIDGQDVNVVLGGGILADVSDPYIHHNAFENNGSNDVYSGGAAQLTSSAEDWSFDNRFENYNPRCDVEEFRLSDNLYNGNDAQFGNTMANRYHEDEFDMSGSIFDVFDCGNEESAVSTIWVKVEPEASVEYADGAGQLCAFTAPHVYVDSSIPQECLDEGCGFIDNPFKTIARTLELINPTEDNPITIHLAAGTYSPETGESFPINMLSNVNIVGEDEETSIISAGCFGGFWGNSDNRSTIQFKNNQNNLISNVAINGGCDGELIYVDDDPLGEAVRSPAISIKFSNSITLSHLTTDGYFDDGFGDWWTWGGLGISSYLSNITLTDVTIKNYWNAGIYLYRTNANIVNMIVENCTTDNSANNLGGVIVNNAQSDCYLYEDNVLSEDDGSCDHYITSITNSTITGSTEGWGLVSRNANVEIKNSIIWNNDGESGEYNNIGSIYHFDTGKFIISYSNIAGLTDLDLINNQNHYCGNCFDIWGTFIEIEGNIDIDPIFTDPENGDYTLQEGSPCIDTGNPNLWFQDLDGTPSDMGVTGGLFISPSFTSYDFGEVGGVFGLNKDFTLYNYRDTPITIIESEFNTTSFNSNTSFPITINPLQSGVINIEVNHSNAGDLLDEMKFISEDLPEDISISLSAISSTGEEEVFILSGNLSGSYPTHTVYRIISDINIESTDTVYLGAGTQFLFDGNYSFEIHGTLKAIGTETEKIIFDYDFNNNGIPGDGFPKWKGIILDHANDDTIFEYVDISNTSGGGGMTLYYSNPHINNVIISDNISNDIECFDFDYEQWDYLEMGLDRLTCSPGMNIIHSNPNLNNLIISSNDIESDILVTAAMNVLFSNNDFKDVEITNNNCIGILIIDSSPNFSDVTIADNFLGVFIHLSSPIIKNAKIVQNNSINNWGPNTPAGIFVDFNSNINLINATIADNHGIGITIFDASYWDNWNYPQTIRITNSILWNNTTLNLDLVDWNEPPVNIPIEGNYNINYNDIGSELEFDECTDDDGSCEEFDFDGNINADPQFTDPENGYYTLQEGSPCIDSGTADIDGDSVDDITDYIGSAPDMGAYEYCLTIDECGVCSGDSSNDCVQDCAGVWGGTAVIDDCGVCGGDNSTCFLNYYLAGQGECNEEFEEDEICEIQTLDDCFILCSGQFWCEAFFFDDICCLLYSQEMDFFMGDCENCGCYNLSYNIQMAGDTNFDGIVDILDIVRIINQIMGHSEFNDDEFTAADFNFDGIVDVLDIVQIVNYILP